MFVFNARLTKQIFKAALHLIVFVLVKYIFLNFIIYVIHFNVLFSLSLTNL